jgi:hypothetical protein
MSYRISSTVRKLALGLAVIALSLFAAASGTEAALTGLCTYYNNDQHSQVVGQRGKDCCGNPVSWGSTSSFYECHQEYCVWCPPESI